MSRKFSTVPKPSNSENRKLGYAAGVVSFFTFLSRILGLVRDMVIAGLFGSGLAADAFFVAFRIPNLLRRLFAEGSLTIAFIPIFTEYLTLKTRKDAFDLARVVLTLLSILLALVTLLGILFSPWIVRVQAFGFGGSGIKYDLTVLLTRIMFPYIFFISLVAFFMGVLNSLRRFAAPAAAPILLNVGIIAAAYLISPHCAAPIVGIAIGVLIGGALQVGLQIPSVIREGLILLPKWNPTHPALKRIGFLMLPAIFGSAVYQVNQFMGTLLATFLEEGSVSWLYYADRLVQFPLGIFAIAISTAALPSLSTEAAKNDLVQFQSTLNHALCLVFFITFPSMAGLMVLGEPLVQLLFERGAFDSHASIMTAHALLYYTVGLWAFSGVRVMVSAFYALQDTKTPVKVATVALALNLGLSLLLMGPLKHGGLALALSLASSVQFCLLIFLLKRRGSLINIKPVIISSAKSALAALLMGVGVYGCFSRWLTIDPETGASRMGIRLAALIVIGIIIYFGAARVLGCNEIRSIRYMLLRKRTKRRSAG
ncbi:MAG TPA: murein biosynthesis integral membrane protein MurJ [Desulfobacteraceae bacterium]|nr:murein biosynthesis integral membrane protein MurJ [Desulfobacteraceae bacterium]